MKTDPQLLHHVPEVLRRLDERSVEWHDEANLLVVVHDRRHVLPSHTTDYYIPICDGIGRIKRC